MSFHENFLLWFHSAESVFGDIWLNAYPYFVVLFLVFFLVILAFWIFAFLLIGLQMTGWRFACRFVVWLCRRNLAVKPLEDCVFGLVREEAARLYGLKSS